jgi:phosphoribosylformylglycinamidine cyclo-ligase
MCSPRRLATVEYPETFDPGTPSELVYSGQARLTDPLEGTPLDFGKAVLSPTRTYAPVVNEVFRTMRSEIHGMVHCSGGAQTKVLHFVEGLRIIKDDLLPIPPLFDAIQRMSGTDWKEMYKVFNMGHRLEFYVPPSRAQEIIAISKSFGIDAKVIGRVEAAPEKEVVFTSPHGTFTTTDQPALLHHCGSSYVRPPIQTLSPLRSSRRDRQTAG